MRVQVDPVNVIEHQLVLSAPLSSAGSTCDLPPCIIPVCLLALLYKYQHEQELAIKICDRRCLFYITQFSKRQPPKQCRLYRLPSCDFGSCDPVTAFRLPSVYFIALARMRKYASAMCGCVWRRLHNG